MTLAKRLAAAEPLRTGKPCGVGRVLASLSKEDAEALKAAMAIPKGDPQRLSSNQIANILREEGHDIHHKSVEVHRKGACRCEPGRPPSP